MKAKKKPPAPPPYRCGRGPKQPPQPFSEIELAWLDWRAAVHEQARLYRRLELAESHSEAAALKARTTHTLAAERTRDTKRRLGKLAYQVVGAIPHELPKDPQP